MFKVSDSRENSRQSGYAYVSDLTWKSRKQSPDLPSSRRTPNHCAIELRRAVRDYDVRRLKERPDLPPSVSDCGRSNSRLGGSQGVLHLPGLAKNESASEVRGSLPGRALLVTVKKQSSSFLTKAPVILE